MPPPDDSEWNPPEWVWIGKHHSRPDQTWNDLLRRSAGRDGDGVYRISSDEARRIELAAVTNPAREIHPRKNPHERHFWDLANEDIGASKGERTRYIYVLYSQGGAVHGYPVNPAILRRFGVDV